VKRQQGVSLIVVMISLTIMLFAAAGIFRTTNGTLALVGNLGFKKNATSVGDAGVEVARAWIVSRTLAQLASADATAGYFEVMNEHFDPLTYDWGAAGNSVQATADDGTGNSVIYVIHRMCNNTGTIDAPGQLCVLAQPFNASGSNQINSLTSGVGSSKKPYYRITSRVQGPRNTLSYIQVMVY
jgi:Tfp pilus assembly protein PilX